MTGPPRDFLANDPKTTALLTPEQVALVAEEPNGGQAYIVLVRRNGSLASLTIKHLLPDEVEPVASSR